MTQLAMRGSRSSASPREQTEEERQCYRRWARASHVVDFILFAALLIGCSLYDRQASRMALNDLTAGVEMSAMPASPQNTSGARRRDSF